MSERLDIVPVPGPGRAPAEVCLPGLRDHGGAQAPARLIEGGLPTDATVAQVLVAKYVNHLPLLRKPLVRTAAASDHQRA